MKRNNKYLSEDEYLAQMKKGTLAANEVPIAFEKQRGVSYDIPCIFEEGQSASFYYASSLSASFLILSSVSL